MFEAGYGPEVIGRVSKAGANKVRRRLMAMGLWKPVPQVRADVGYGAPERPPGE